MKTVRIGLAGFGTVGSAVYKRLAPEANLIAKKFGIRPVITAIAVRNPRRARAVALPQSPSRFRSPQTGGT